MNGIIQNQNRNQFLIYKKLEIKIKTEMQKAVLFKTESENQYKVLSSNNDIIAIIFNSDYLMMVKGSQKNQKNKHFISKSKPKVSK